MSIFPLSRDRGASRRLATALAAALLLSLPAASVAAAPKRHAQHLSVSEAGETTRVTVGFTRVPTFTARMGKGGRRIVIDVPNADVKGAPPAFTKERGLVAGVMLQDFSARGRGKGGTSKTTRILVTLTKKAQYSVVVVGKELVVRVSEKPIPAMGKAPAAAPARKPDVVEVTDVRFDHADQEDRVLVDVAESVTFSKHDGRRVARLTLRGAALPKALHRTLDVSAFQGRIGSVSSFSRKGGTVTVEVRKAPNVRSRVLRQGTNLVWSFYRPGELPASETGVARDGKAARQTRTLDVEQAGASVPKVHDGYVPEDEPTERTGSPAEASGFGPKVAAQARRGYSGRRIDLDLKDADIGNVLRLIAEVGRVNIVAGDGVKGKVTMLLRNIPWDQALDVILRAKNLGMVRVANMIRVAPLDALQEEREARLARAKSELQLAPIVTRIVPVSYAFAGKLQGKAQGLLSSRGRISVDERTNVLIVRDVASNVRLVEELVRTLDTQTPQVLIEARVVEATTQYLKDVGIQWGGDATFSQVTGNPTGLAFPNRIGLTGGASDNQTPTAGLSPFQQRVQNPNFAVNLPAAVGTGSGGALGLTFGSVDNNVNLAVRLTAAESTGLLRIISSPRVLTLDNYQARISQGTLIPYSVISAQGVQTQFQEAKLQLLVVPHVTADGSIVMKVKVNRDEPDFNQTSARGDPTILKREAETTLLVQDGHTAVIGGIFTRSTGRSVDQVPFFGDIPILGLLFQRRRSTDLRNELVIFITPRIVNRSESLGR